MVRPRLCVEVLETKRWLELCLESLWQTTQKPYLQRAWAPELCQARGRQDRVASGIYICSRFCFSVPLPGPPAGHRMSGSRWEARDFLRECSEGNSSGSEARLFLSLESHEFGLGPVPSSPFLFSDSSACVPGRAGTAYSLLLEVCWEHIGGFIFPHTCICSIEKVLEAYHDAVWHL